MTPKWQTRRLGELAELRGRIGWRGLTAKEYTKSGPLFLSVHSLNNGDYVDLRDAVHISQARYVESPEIMLQKDDVLICKDGAGIGKVGIVGEVPDPTTINSSLLLIRSGSDILPKFLYRCLSSPYFQAIVNSRLNGATTPHLYQRDITEFPVVLPSLAEQRRIVAILDEAFDDIAIAVISAQRNLRNAHAIFESELNCLLTRRGDGWSRMALRDLGVTQTGTTPPTNDPGNYGGFIPFVKPSHFKPNGTLDLSAAGGLSRKGQSQGRVVVAGSALMVCIGATIGKCGFNECDVTTNQQVNSVSPKAGVVGKFLYYSFLTTEFQQEVKSNSGQATLPVISKSKWSALRVWIPESVDEQERIVRVLDEVRARTDEVRTVYQRKLDKLGELKKSLLDQAFSGNL